MEIQLRPNISAIMGHVTISVVASGAIIEYLNRNYLSIVLMPINRSRGIDPIVGKIKIGP